MDKIKRVWNRLRANRLENDGQNTIIDTIIVALIAFITPIFSASAIRPLMPEKIYDTWVHVINLLFIVLFYSFFRKFIKKDK